MRLSSPPDPFEPFIDVLPAGSELFRLFTAAPGRRVTTFNPGTRTAPVARFSFFGSPRVPVLYAAETEAAAICETVLHDVPVSGGDVASESVDRLVSGKLRLTRDIRVAVFLGTGLRRLGVTAAGLTATPAYCYPSTVLWAQAAHQLGCDGIVWMSHRCNSDRSYVLFGDHVAATDLAAVDDYGRIFAAGPDRDWLIEFCAPLRITILPPG